MFAEGSPSGVKAYLSEMGLCQNTFRLPVWKVSEGHHQKIKELMKTVWINKLLIYFHTCLNHTFTISLLCYLYHFLLLKTLHRLEIKSLPAYHATGSNIYTAGSFNGWNPQDEQYKFKRDDKGNYFLELKIGFR